MLPTYIKLLSFNRLKNKAKQSKTKQELLTMREISQRTSAGIYTALNEGYYKLERSCQILEGLRMSLYWMLSTHSELYENSCALNWEPMTDSICILCKAYYYLTDGISDHWRLLERGKLVS